MSRRSRAAHESAAAAAGQVDLSVSVGSVALRSVLCTASGTAGHGAELAPYVDLAALGAVVVKSPHCEPHMFKEWAAQYIDVDAPGSTSANLRRLGHTKCTRPMFPLDADMPFQPQAKLFQRHP